ncbi:hypothetical protein CBI38_32450 (plasmid) [Rhodococcus oxybenzonivorans]|uniref:Uncharacterized protein n=1 Tax=Rhodococcus oxybenzonivorans TaxID=1990687 RepID=A0A2S2C5Q8_9NOCA|nr:hypothetical protein CBI38_32450 [Rhodococcus oxybenzonivorans]
MGLLRHGARSSATMNPSSATGASNSSSVLLIRTLCTSAAAVAVRTIHDSFGKLPSGSGGAER